MICGGKAEERDVQVGASRPPRAFGRRVGAHLHLECRRRPEPLLGRRIALRLPAIAWHGA